jgi:hypothetical protein
MEVVNSNYLNEIINKNAERIIFSEVIAVKDAVISAAQKGYSGMHVKLSPKVVLYKTELLNKLKTVFPDSEIKILLPENILTIVWRF